MDEILLLFLITYILFGIALYHYIVYDIKHDSDYVSWLYDFLDEVEEERDAFAAIYAIILMILMLPVLMFLFLVYLIKNIFRRR